jgi:hypothetical protein
MIMKQKPQSEQVTVPKRISPELAEVLHMLKSLETQQTDAPAGTAARS